MQTITFGKHRQLLGVTMQEERILNSDGREVGVAKWNAY